MLFISSPLDSTRRLVATWLDTTRRHSSWHNTTGCHSSRYNTTHHHLTRRVSPHDSTRHASSPHDSTQHNSSPLDSTQHNSSTLDSTVNCSTICNIETTVGQNNIACYQLFQNTTLQLISYQMYIHPKLWIQTYKHLFYCGARMKKISMHENVRPIIKWVIFESFFLLSVMKVYIGLVIPMLLECVSFLVLFLPWYCLECMLKSQLFVCKASIVGGCMRKGHLRSELAAI